jgi:hypothetical protein
MMDSVMVVVVVVKASHPVLGAGKGVCWETRDANDNQGGNRDDNSKRHDQSSLRLLGLVSCQTQRLWSA